MPADERRARFALRVSVGDCRLRVDEERGQLLGRRGPEPLERRGLGLRIDDPQRRPDLHLVLLEERRALGALGVEREPHELPRQGAHGLVRKDVRAHREARVAPRRPGVDEEGLAHRARLGERRRIIVLDEDGTRGPSRLDRRGGRPRGDSLVGRDERGRRRGAGRERQRRCHHEPICPHDVTSARTDGESQDVRAAACPSFEDEVGTGGSGNRSRCRTRRAIVGANVAAMRRKPRRLSR